MNKYLVYTLRIVFLVLFFVLLRQGKMMLWLALYGGSLIAAIVLGRVYCGIACPMNTVMMPVDRLAKKLNLQKLSPPKWLASGYFAWVALVASVAVVIGAQRILQRSIPILLIWLAIAVVATLLWKPAVFHNLICPFGPLQKVFGRFAMFSQRVDKDACISCKKCEKVCPSEAIAVQESDKKALIDESICLQCTECAQVCPTKAIRYQGKKRENAA